MSKKKILFVTQELTPYTELTILSDLARKIPQLASDEGFEIRILMPKFGIINERRHRLHEVVRLSGMNIIVDDEDYPLIIKVASLPGLRLQVYFLDSEEFFKRKSVFHNDENVPFEDNPERLVFFCKGVMETVKKFGWAPDIVHLHGQITSLIPLYLKKAYRNDPVFQDAKIVYSVYDDELGSNFDSHFLDIAAINDLEREDLLPFVEDDMINLNSGAIKYSDGTIAGNESADSFVNTIGAKENKPFLLHQPDMDIAVKGYFDFFRSLLD
ncbi:MAG: glycogen/starch synthase [Saprospiraceae bacterium]